MENAWADVVHLTLLQRGQIIRKVPSLILLFARLGEDTEHACLLVQLICRATGRTLQCDSDRDSDRVYPSVRRRQGVPFSATATAHTLQCDGDSAMRSALLQGCSPHGADSFVDSLWDSFRCDHHSTVEHFFGTVDHTIPKKRDKTSTDASEKRARHITWREAWPVFRM